VFRPVSAELDFVALEEAELARWRTNDVFTRSMKHREGAEPWVFYEGPPTANGKPGLHHVWARVYKDLFCRYQTMQGRYVARRAGWDTHGLPVEVQVEKQLGISGKKAIVEQVGVEEFTRLCRESVLTFVGEFERLTERIGYWTDMEHAYYTFHPAYVESVCGTSNSSSNTVCCMRTQGHSLLPRCGTALSSHELGQPEVYTTKWTRARTSVRDHRRERARSGRPTHLAVWTTTPWTLLSNVAVAVNPEITYALVDGVVVAAELVESVFAPASRRARRSPVAPWRACTTNVPSRTRRCRGRRRRYVVLADYVTNRGRYRSRPSGTGLWRNRPSGRARTRSPTLNPVGPDGKFTAEIQMARRDTTYAKRNPVINDETRATRAR